MTFAACYFQRCVMCITKRMEAFRCRKDVRNNMRVHRVERELGDGENTI